MFFCLLQHILFLCLYDDEEEERSHHHMPSGSAQSQIDKLDVFCPILSVQSFVPFLQLRKGLLANVGAFGFIRGLVDGHCVWVIINEENSRRSLCLCDDLLWLPTV
ncbi:hypothetical protein CHARACLAT_023009 [Characodon lateralis]|uniref:Secreted protein n=1 Tax=Characodon lateralis TaxID=208331 RepID=A0ABU7D015_9TELE|nr:hypothetical protein [Characodon lateralis]